jgi:glycosyltransferase involved in cell wall biosynthesis
MKISIIGPGIMPIPPLGWGAVESLIWDYKTELEKIGHTVQIVNSPDLYYVANTVNQFNPDFVHLQYDDHIAVLHAIDCPNKAVTSHYGYIEQYIKHPEYHQILNSFVVGDFFIFCLSEGIKKVYESLGVDSKRLFVTPNGARKDLFEYTTNPIYPEKSVYLAKIDYRKRQYLFQNIFNLDFVGNLHDNRFDQNRTNYLGEWSKNALYSNLTHYGNLVLLSDGEADPLVTKEALVAGLGLVLSEFATANLDLSLPFIDVIPEDKILDLEYVRNIIENNGRTSVSMRDEIRDYALKNVTWDVVVPEYAKLIENII